MLLYHIERSPVHVEHVVRAVADSLCAIDGVSRKMNEGTGEYRCTVSGKEYGSYGRRDYGRYSRMRTFGGVRLLLG